MTKDSLDDASVHDTAALEITQSRGMIKIETRITPRWS
jgi:hypothetical protein